MTKQIQVFTRLWTKEEHELIKNWYGKVRTTCLIDILGRGSIKGIHQKFSYYGWEPNTPLYGVIEIEYQGKTHQAKGFTYKKEGNSVKNQVAKTKAGFKPRKLKPLTVKAVKVNESRPKKEFNPYKQKAEIQPFVQPEGKVLTLVSHFPKTYKYI